MSDDKKRRKFLKQIAGLGVLGLAAVGTVAGGEALLAEEKLRLRPPGAMPEHQFLALCIKCGQCLQVCPYDSILLEDVDNLAALGTAYIDPDRRGCYLCKALPCILACPSGALDHSVADDVRKIHMGVAVIANQDACLALYHKPVPEREKDLIFEHTKVLTPAERKQKKIFDLPNASEKRQLQINLLKKVQSYVGKECTICADLCPYPEREQAIGMVAKNGGYLPEIREKCVGCGACVELCPTDVLQVIPRATYDEVYGKKAKV